MSFSMSGSNSYSYNRFDAYEAQQKKLREEAAKAEAAKQEPATLSEEHLPKDEREECSKCKGKGCDHCDGEGYHAKKKSEKRWQDSDGDGKWYEKGEDVKEAADPRDAASMKKFQALQKNVDQKRKAKKESERSDAMPAGDVGHDIHARAVAQYNKQNPSKAVKEFFSPEELEALSEKLNLSEEQLDEVVGAVLAGIGDAVGGAAKGVGNAVGGVASGVGSAAGGVTRGVKKAVTGKNEKEIEAENQVKVREEVEAIEEGKSERPLGVMHQFARGVKQERGAKKDEGGKYLRMQHTKKQNEKEEKKEAEKAAAAERNATPNRGTWYTEEVEVVEEGKSSRPRHPGGRGKLTQEIRDDKREASAEFEKGHTEGSGTVTKDEKKLRKQRAMGELDEAALVEKLEATGIFSEEEIAALVEEEKVSNRDILRAAAKKDNAVANLRGKFSEEEWAKAAKGATKYGKTHTPSREDLGLPPKKS